MGVIQRFKDIMSANINAMLDKAENPEKMIDQYRRNLEDDLGKVKAETASVMAEEARAKRAYDEALAEVEKYQKYAEKGYTSTKTHTYLANWICLIPIRCAFTLPTSIHRKL